MPNTLEAWMGQETRGKERRETSTRPRLPLLVRAMALEYNITDGEETMKQPHDQPHDQTELEFVAKQVNDLLKRKIPNRKLVFLTFISDVGEGGYLGYISSARRIDAIRLITEWLARMLPRLTKEQRREMLELFDGESDAGK